MHPRRLYAEALDADRTDPARAWVSVQEILAAWLLVLTVAAAGVLPWLLALARA